MGTGARFGTPPLRLMDLGTGQIFLDMGANLKNGAGISYMIMQYREGADIGM